MYYYLIFNKKSLKAFWLVSIYISHVACLMNTKVMALIVFLLEIIILQLTLTLLIELFLFRY